MVFAALEIDPDKLYPEYELRKHGGVFTESSLRRARQRGHLKWSAPTPGKRFYRGQWLLDWLSREERDVKDR